ncbi:MAG TPA: ligase-associated DNA damage response endonuclease PdeM [Stellaceae bacterium]|nr:ligase-associated DNA damage response endonuclease PdeM [Stellaceae bacterium]
MRVFSPQSDAAGGLLLNGVELFAEPSGALWWPAAATLIVADLHFEKGSSYATRGVLLPPYDTRATLARLAAAIGPRVRRVICLGDSFHDGNGPERLSQNDAAALRALVEKHDWIWIAGNHDPVLPAMIGGRTIVGELRLDGLVLRHQAESEAIGEISGHYHPKSHIDVRGQRLSGACFIHDERRIVLPAFGAYTGGLHIESEAIRALFPAAFRIDIVLRGQIMRREYPIEAA